MIKLIFMYTRPKLTISTKKKKFKKNCLKKVCKLGILGHSEEGGGQRMVRRGGLGMVRDIHKISFRAFKKFSGGGWWWWCSRK